MLDLFKDKLALYLGWVGSLNGYDLVLMLFDLLDKPALFHSQGPNYRSIDNLCDLYGCTNHEAS